MGVGIGGLEWWKNLGGGTGAQGVESAKQTTNQDSGGGAVTGAVEQDTDDESDKTGGGTGGSRGEKMFSS